MRDFLAFPRRRRYHDSRIASAIHPPALDPPRLSVSPSKETTMPPSCLLILVPLALAMPLLGVHAGDSPQWRGPKRDAICTETGLLKEWPKGGPKLLWKITGLGDGFSEVSIANGRIYTMGERQETPQAKDKETFVIALDEKDGKEKWATRIGAKYGDGGPRSTPTV